MDWAVRTALIVNLLGVFGALAAPFAVRRLKGPRAASVTSKLFTAVALVGAVAAIAAFRLAEVPGNTRFLFFIVPLTIFAGATCVYWTVIGLIYANRSDLERTIKNRERRARARREMK